MSQNPTSFGVDLAFRVQGLRSESEMQPLDPKPWGVNLNSRGMGPKPLNPKPLRLLAQQKKVSVNPETITPSPKP